MRGLKRLGWLAWLGCGWSGGLRVVLWAPLSQRGAAKQAVCTPGGYLVVCVSGQGCLQQLMVLAKAARGGWRLRIAVTRWRYQGTRVRSVCILPGVRTVFVVHVSVVVVLCVEGGARMGGFSA